MESKDPSGEIIRFLNSTKILPEFNINIDNSGSLVIVKKMIKQARVKFREHENFLDSLPYSLPNRNLVPVHTDVISKTGK